MGWWGTGLFHGDQPLDWVGEVTHFLAGEVEKAFVEDPEIAPAKIFILAEWLMKYDRRSDKLIPAAEWLAKYKADSWKSNAKREQSIAELKRWLEIAFKLDKSGYKLDPKDAKPVYMPGTEVYHLTRKEHIDSIRQKGLEARQCFAGFFENRQGVYVSLSIDGAYKWRHHVADHDYLIPVGIVKFTISEADTVYKDERVDFNDDFVIANHIEPMRVTVFA